MKFNIDDYKGKYAMHCKTEEEAKDFCRYLDSIGRHWINGKDYAKETYYENYGRESCYNFNCGSFCSLSYYLNLDYTILEWSDFMNKEFTKADLKNGDVVLRRDGSVEIVCIETGTLISVNGCDALEDVGENLADFRFNDSDLDIVAVRRPTKSYHCQFCAFDKKLGDLVYEREEVKEMTLEEVCKALGKKIKIVKSKG